MSGSTTLSSSRACRSYLRRLELLAGMPCVTVSAKEPKQDSRIFPLACHSNDLAISGHPAGLTRRIGSAHRYPVGNLQHNPIGLTARLALAT